MRLLIGGDIAPTKSNEDIFVEGDVESLLKNGLYKFVMEYDFRIFNLEVPLSYKKNPIKKYGPNLIANPDTVNGIEKLKPILTLANNHILDQDIDGLKSTISILDKNNIFRFGAGLNLEEAKKPLIIEKDGIKVGLYSCSQNEFTIASIDRGGANPFDIYETFDEISKLKDKCDYVLVIYHGGKEHYRYPSPNLQKICRKFVNKGANLVICQHSHCIGSKEEYNEASIIYGQGNFIFDMNRDSEFWDTGLLLDIEIDKELKVEYIPIVRDGSTIKLANKSEAKKIKEEFLYRSEQIKNDKFIKDEFDKLVNTNINQYINVIRGSNRLFRKLDRIFKNRLIKKIYKGKRKYGVINYIESEDHREILLKVLEKI